MADLNEIFPDHGDAPKVDHDYSPGEALEIDGPALNFERVSLKIVSLKSEATHAMVTQDTKSGEYDFVLRPEFTNVFPTTSTAEDPALAYELRGEKTGEGSKSIQVGFLTTEATEHAQDQEETGDRKPETESGWGEDSQAS